MSDPRTPAEVLLLLFLLFVLGVLVGVALRGYFNSALTGNPDTPDVEVIYVPKLVPIPVTSPPKECPEFI